MLILHVRCYGQVFSRVKDPVGLHIHEKGVKRTHDKQETHSLDAVKLLEFDLKQTLLGLAQKLFGKCKFFVYFLNVLVF